METGRLIKKKNIIHIILIVVIGAVVWFNSLGGGFHYDDFHVLEKASPAFGINNMRFAGWLTLYVNSLFGESNALFYHLTNLLIHICSSVCVYFIVLLLIKKDNANIPFYAAVLFLVHPLATEPVNYISARFTQLAALSCFMTLLFFIMYIETRKVVYVALTVMSFIVGVYSKEVGIFYVTAGLFAYCFCFPDWKKFFIGRMKALLYGAVVILLFLIMITFAVDRLKSPYFWQHLLVQNKVFLLGYVKLMLIPLGLNVDHFVTPPVHFLFDFRILASIIFNITAIAYAVLVRQKKRLVSFAIIWIYLMSFPYFLLTTKELMVEYRAYPMLFGFALLAGYFIGNYVNRKEEQRVVFLVIVFFLGVISISRNRVWSDDMLLWQDAAGKSPQSARAFCNLGLAYKNKGFHDRALKAFDRSLELRFQYPFAVLMNRGVVYCEKGFYAQAVDDFTRAIRLVPNRPQLYLNRGRAYLEKKSYEEAVVDFTRVVELQPGDAGAYYYRGKACEEMGLHEESMDDLNRAIELDPEMANAWFVRGNIYLEKGFYAQAINDYKKTVELNPGNSNAYNNLGSACAGKGLYEIAIKYYSIAIKKSPDYIPAYKNRAAIYHRTGKKKLAIRDEIRIKEITENLAIENIKKGKSVK